MSRQNIPQELRELPQWVGATKDKLPIDPKTGRSASVTDRGTWGTFEQACSCGTLYIGFVFTKEDPYVFIDLDTGKNHGLAPLHAEIVLGADSYTETSQSGTSSHVIVKGGLRHGLRDDTQHIEVYPDGRYAIMTGWVYQNDTIRECQALLDYLVQKIGAGRKVIGAGNDLESSDEVMTDEQVWSKAVNAQNGDKFAALFKGEWEQFTEYSNDRSRADLGLMTMIDFYTQNVEQAVRLFKRSAMYRPEKGRRGGDGTDYIVRTLKGARVRNVDQRDVDMTGLTEKAAEVLAKSVPGIPVTVGSTVTVGELTEKKPIAKGIQFAPGLVGEIANYILATALRPVPEVALMGALAFVAGIVGRQFNIPGSGLNLYLILLAATGTGKEGAGAGIQMLTSKVRETCPMVDQFTGPAEFASGPALIKALDAQPCFYSLVGEFGLRMQQLVDPRAHGGEKTLMRALLNLFSKSGWNQSESSTAYSDIAKNTQTLYAPALTIFGESTPESFFDGLDERLVTSGLLPRFLTVEYTGDRPPKNTASAFCEPDPLLVDKVSQLVSTVISMQQNNSCQPVLFDTEAQKMLDDFDKRADKEINNGTEVYKQLWNRSHLKALRLAGIIAVGNNCHQPVVTAVEAAWALDIVIKDVELISSKFKDGLVGSGENRYEAEVRGAILDYMKMSPEKRATYQVPKKVRDNPGVIPYTYLRRRLRQITAMKQDRRGLSRAIQDTIKDLVEAGILAQIPPIQRDRDFGVKADLYILGESW